MKSTMTLSTSEKFHNGEQLWFWFVYSKSVQHGVARIHGNPTRRPCELLDVETLVTKLYLCGKLTAEQLNVMKQFGDRRRAPNQHVWSENRAAALWCDAIATLTAAARTRGWID
ncbi:MAG: hypothetical protein NC311_00190 [Muribaculaceae bacterium]|nr:hypothetical protein [Muribaculaceae bacterium]